jgi:hypothetical protein
MSRRRGKRIAGTFLEITIERGRRDPEGGADRVDIRPSPIVESPGEFELLGGHQLVLAIISDIGRKPPQTRSFFQISGLLMVVIGRSLWRTQQNADKSGAFAQAPSASAPPSA